MENNNNKLINDHERNKIHNQIKIDSIKNKCKSAGTLSQSKFAKLKSIDVINKNNNDNNLKNGLRTNNLNSENKGSLKKEQNNLYKTIDTFFEDASTQPRS